MNRLCVIVRITLLSVIVAGPLVNQVVMRNAVLGRILADF